MFVNLVRISLITWLWVSHFTLIQGLRDSNSADKCRNLWISSNSDHLKDTNYEHKWWWLNQVQMKESKIGWISAINRGESWTFHFCIFWNLCVMASFAASPALPHGLFGAIVWDSGPLRFRHIQQLFTKWSNFHLLRKAWLFTLSTICCCSTIFSFFWFQDPF